MVQSLITEKFRTQLSNLFIDSINDANLNYYLVIAHVNAWANDSIPDSPVDTRDTEVNIWRSMIGGKKVTGNDLYHVVPRIDWTANTVYAQYTDRNTSIYGTNFYVVTSEFNVYKCIDNNYSANSVIMPTYTKYDQLNTETDGYVWKYMYTLTTEERVRFLTANWLPVHFQSLDDGSLQWDVQQNALDGGIESIAVANGGSGYSNTSNIVITIVGDGVSANATANIDNANGSIHSIILTNPGSGFRFANVEITSDSGSGAAANATISPMGGHGSNPVEELGASNLMINIRLKDSEDGMLTLQNDYRQIGLIRNPLIYGEANTLYTNSTFSQVTTLVVSSGSDDYQLDEYVYQGSSLNEATFSARVVDWYSSNSTLNVIETVGTPTSATLIGASSGVSRFLASTENGDLIPYSGGVLYVHNVSPITRSLNQTESITMVIQF